MWKDFMEVMVTLVAAVIVIVGFVTMLVISSDNVGFGFLVGILIIVIGFTVIGTTGMIVEGVGYLKIIAEATKNGQIQFVANPNMQNENYSGMQQNAYTQVCGQVFQQSAVNTDKEVSNEDWLEILKEDADSTTARKVGWTCSECGEKNRTNYLYCKYCGTHK